MAFNPELGSTSPAVLLDNAERLDKLVNGPAADVPDRGGDPLYSWRQMMAKNDEIRQNLIPLSRQYMTLAAAQADIANIPEGAATYVRSPDDSDGKTLAVEYKNIGGSLVATGRRFSSQEYVDSVNEYVITRLYEETLPGIPVAFIDDNRNVFLYSTDAGDTHVPGLSLQYCADITYTTQNIPGVAHVELDENGYVLRWIDDAGVSHSAATDSGADITYTTQNIPGVAHVELDENGYVLRWIDDAGVSHSAATDSGSDPVPVTTASAVISPQVYDNALVTELGYNQWINNIAVKFGRDYFFSAVRLGTTSPSRIYGALAISRRQGERGRFGLYEFAQQESTLGSTASADDHDAPSILLDTRDDAENPITIFQADHAGARLRKWESPTLDPANIANPVAISDSPGMTYAQSYRNPNNQDEIMVFSRLGTTNSARWFVHLSTDNGKTWQLNAFIGGADLYMTSCQSMDGSAVHL
ncbi:flagellar biosynthesis protein, partial [Klebsiella pneumoniae]